MESGDEVSNTEPQLTYWNPQYRCDAGFPSEMTVGPICPIQFLDNIDIAYSSGDVFEINALNTNILENQSLFTQEIENPDPSTRDPINSDSFLPEPNSIPDLEFMQQLSHESSCLTASDVTIESSSNNQEEVIKAAKTLFTKRTRTLFSWVHPGQSKTKLKTIVSRAWDTLPQAEKRLYINQVLNPFRTQTSTLMVNPQLGGIKSWLDECNATRDNKETVPVTKKDDDKNGEGSKKKCKKEKLKKVLSRPRRKYRRSTTKKEEPEEEEEENDDILSTSTFDDQEAVALAKLKKIEKELNRHCFDEDPELAQELENFNRMLTEEEERDLWSCIDLPEPEQLFSDLNF